MAYGTKDDLYAAIQAHIVQTPETVLVCIDEIQEVAEREQIVVSLRAEYPHIDFYVTGSNSTMMSSQLTTLLR